MRKIDAYPHILPQAYYERIRDVTSPAAHQIRAHAARPCLYDLDVRFRVMDQFDDYVQVLTLALPAIEALADGPAARDFARLANDSMADLVIRYPDRFVGFAAAVPMHDIDGALTEIERATRDLGALGVQIQTNVNGMPLDDPRFEPFFARMAALEKPIWVHPTRSPSFADYPTETESKFGLWLAFGWPYETAIFMSRLILSGVLDRHPSLRILTHHLGSIVPHLAGRIDLVLEHINRDRPLVQDADGERKRLVDYYKMFYGDTALVGSQPAVECGLAFLGIERVLFGTDMPFDAEDGPGFIRDAIGNIEAIFPDDEPRQQIYAENARRILGVRG